MPQTKNNSSKYIRTYPINWPEFSTRNYTKDQEGFWEYTPKMRVRKNRLMKPIHSEENSEYDSDENENIE